MRELGAGSHSRLAEDARGASRSPRGSEKEAQRLPIRQAGGDEPRDVELLRCQLVAGSMDHVDARARRSPEARPVHAPPVARCRRPRSPRRRPGGSRGQRGASAGAAACRSRARFARAPSGSASDRATRALHGRRLRPRAGRRAAEELGDRMWAAGAAPRPSVREQRLGLLSFAGARERLDERRQDRPTWITSVSRRPRRI